MLGKPHTKRLIILGAVGGGVWMFFLFTFFSIQILHHHYWFEEALSQQVVRLRGRGERGKIYDRSFQLLATNLKGRRWYPLGTSLCHVLGFSNLDGEGLEGVELYYDQYLQGDGTGLVLLTDAKGNRFPPPGLPLPPRGGENLCLTIDADYQRICEEELRKGVERTQAKGGSVVIISPPTGEILAMVNLPDYDANLPQRSNPQARRNRAITDEYEPGSTFKLVTAAAGLEEGIISPADSIWCENGAITVAGTRIRDNERFGWLTFREIIERSSNVGAIKLAEKVGKDNFYRYARSLGFGSPTGVDFPGEPGGLLRAPEKWSGLSLASMAIGQEVAVTPLQLLNAYCCVANEGLLMQPHLLRAILDQKGRPVREYSPTPIRRALSPSTAHLLTDLLVGVVEEGTGREAKIEGVRVAGKTGTAQKPHPNSRGYTDGGLIISFVGYLPASNPRWAGLVLIDEPQRERTGGKGAAPVFRRIMERILSQEGLPQRRIPQRDDQLHRYVVVPNVLNIEISQALLILKARELRGEKEGRGRLVSGQSPPPGSLIPKGTRVKLTLSSSLPPHMPDLRGMSLRRGVSLLSCWGLQIEVEGEGIITAQAPQPGEEISPGSQCHLVCSPE